MALWHCKGCGTAYAVGLSRCPQCRSTRFEEDAMPKITSSGVSFAGGHEPLSGEQSGNATAASAVDVAETVPAGPIPVADQLAAGVPPDQTVTIADQKAGANPPPLPPKPPAPPEAPGE